MKAQDIMNPVDSETRALYIALYNEKGIDHAITQLHNDIGVLEVRVFEGGFDHDRFVRVQNLRLLARELWNLKLRKDTTKAYGEAAAAKSFGKDFAKS